MNKKTLILFLFFILASNSVLAKTTIINKSRIEFINKKYGYKARKRTQRWIKLLKSNQNNNIVTKLKVVNDFFNKITFLKDNKHWRKKDYWATPFEFIGTGAGDSEDFAIAKYFTLLELGIPDKNLELTYITYKKENKYSEKKQIVLIYKHIKNGTPIVLDHFYKELHLSTKRKDLIPNYSFKKIINKNFIRKMIKLI